VGLMPRRLCRPHETTCGHCHIDLAIRRFMESGGSPAGRLPIAPPLSVSPETIAAVARVLRSGEPAALMLTGTRARNRLSGYCSFGSAGSDSRATPCTTFNRLIERGRGRYPIALLPYPIEPCGRGARPVSDILSWLARKSRLGFSPIPTSPA